MKNKISTPSGLPYNLVIGIAFVMLQMFYGCRSEKVNSNSRFTLAKVEVEYDKFTKQDVIQDSSIINLIFPYRDSMSKEMDQIIGYNAQNMDKKKPNSALGNWMTDVLKEEAELIFEVEVDFALQNYGGIRVPTLAEGPITKGDLFELMPFDNKLLLLEVPGGVVKQICNRIAGYGGWPMSDGLAFTSKNEKAVDITVSGAALDLDKTYLVAIPDYIANGGDGYNMLKDLKRTDSGVFIRELLISNVERNNATLEDAIIPNNTERIKL